MWRGIHHESRQTYAAWSRPLAYNILRRQRQRHSFQAGSARPWDTHLNKIIVIRSSVLPFPVKGPSEEYWIASAAVDDHKY